MRLIRTFEDIGNLHLVSELYDVSGGMLCIDSWYYAVLQLWYYSISQLWYYNLWYYAKICINNPKLNTNPYILRVESSSTTSSRRKPLLVKRMPAQS